MSTASATGRRRDLGGPAVVVGCVALLAYASLKAAWAAGSTIGVTDPDQWESDLADLNAWQRFVALWGTVLLDAGAALALLTLGRCPPPGPAAARRRLLRRAAALGSVVVGAAGVLGLATTVAGATGAARRPAEPLATWVFLLVYGSFTVVAGSFAVAIRRDRTRDGAMTVLDPRRM